MRLVMGRGEPQPGATMFLDPTRIAAALAPCTHASDTPPVVRHEGVVELHLLDTGHLALEEDGELVVERLHAFRNGNVE